MLDAVHHRGIRLSTGAFRSSPVESLYADSGEPSLSFRRDKLSLQYYVRLLGMPNTLASRRVVNSCGDITFRDRPSSYAPLGLRVRRLMLSLNMENPNVLSSLLFETPPYILDIPAHCPPLLEGPKTNYNPRHVQHLFSEHLLHHDAFTKVYTDGSRSSAGVGAAVVFPEHEVNLRLPPQASSFFAEIVAMAKSLSLLTEQQPGRYVIISDSLSALQVVTNPFTLHAAVVSMHTTLRELQQQGFEVQFCWSPSHVGIRGNERADDLARSAVDRGARIVNMPLPHRDYYPHIRDLLIRRWETLWQRETHNKLRRIKDSVQSWATSYHPTRKKEIILARLRIGHTRLTHGYLMERGVQPYCEDCLVPLTVAHILTECPSLSDARSLSMGADGLVRPLSLSSALGDDPIRLQKLFTFLDLVDLWDQL